MKHLLIADDDRFITEIYKEKFESAGYRVVTVNDGRKAIESLKHEKPDAILLDLDLPDMNGVLVLEFIRTEESLADLPVIIISSSSYFSGMAQAAWDAGATHFINKGNCDLKELVAEVEAVLNLSKSSEEKNTLPKKSNYTVLLVDDDQVIHGVLEFFLKQSGFTVRSAFNGKEAFKIANDNPPDIMILDGFMPEMDGFELMDKWSKHETLSQIPVLMMTSLHDDTKKASMTAKGVVEYLTKPFNLHDLVKLVSKHLNVRD